MSTLTFFIRRCIYSSLYVFDRVFGSEAFPVVIFCYHSIAADDWRFGIDKQSFIRQVDYLLSTRQAVTVDDLTRHISGEKLIDKPSFIICFDDGYKDILSVREYLASHTIKPLLFVLSSPEKANIDELGTKREFLTKEDIQDLHKEGWAIGSHSATHSDFWHLSNQQLYTEIILSRKDLEKDLGFAIKYFAYPRGRYNQDVLRMVERSGYQLAFSMDDGRIDQSTKTFAIPRIGVDRTHVFSEFQRLASPANIFFRKTVKELLV